MLVIHIVIDDRHVGVHNKQLVLRERYEKR
jgi:hypothetical protein